MSAISDVLHELRPRPGLQTDAAALPEADEALAVARGQNAAENAAAPAAISHAPANTAGNEEPR
ncbi:MAG: hypothetical protein ABSH27_12145 [Solirubrobacteraceae bacterium]|jgi:hypothetical protein